MPRYIGELGTDVYGITADEGKIARLSWTAAQAAAAASVHAAITGSSSAVVDVTTAITNPSCPRNLVITPGGTTADVKDASITVTGTNIADQVITEDFAFAANATAATVGVKAFKTVTKISIPAQDGAGATFAVTSGAKLGLPFMFDKNYLSHGIFGAVKETTSPTVVVDVDEVEKNVISFNSTLDGTALEAVFIL